MADNDGWVTPGQPAPAGAPAAASGDGWVIPKAVAATVRNVDKGGDSLGKKIGRAVTYGEQHPFDLLSGVLGAGARGARSALLRATGDTSQPGPWEAITHPSTGAAIFKELKNRVGLQGQEDRGVLAGADLPHKIARGAADFTLDAVTDPVTLFPVGKLASGVTKIASKVVPIVAREAAKEAASGGVKALANTAVGRAVKNTLNPDAYLNGFTPKAKATIERVNNVAKEAAKEAGKADEALVRTHRNAIVSGNLPQEIKNKFATQDDPDAWEEYFRDPETGKVNIGPGLRPQTVLKQLGKVRSAKATKNATEALKNLGFFEEPGAASPLFESGAKETIKATQDRLRKALSPDAPAENILAKLARQSTRLANQGFLAVPFPHIGNLSDLVYGEYGPVTAAKGLANGARIALGKTGGKLGEDLEHLHQGGAKGGFDKLYDEFGFTGGPTKLGQGVANFVNKPLIPAQKALNYVQSKTLNPVETGLRAAALEEERKRAIKTGASDDQILKNIHKALGTNHANALVHAISQLGGSFPQFHAQTVVSSKARALARHPGRLALPLKANRDYNDEVNPGSTKYVPSTPTFGFAKALSEPEDYFTRGLTPLANLNDPYSFLSELKKGKGWQALKGVAQGYQPLGDINPVVVNAALHKKGKAGESALQDLQSLITGGYYSRQKPGGL